MPRGSNALRTRSAAAATAGACGWNTAVAARAAAGALSNIACPFTNDLRTRAASTVAYAAVLTIGLIVVVQKVFGLRLGTTGEMAGMDHELHGEHGYGLLNLN